MTDILIEKLDKLHSILDSLGSAAVAFSGGVDSAFLMKSAHGRLGEKAVAVTIDSPLIPRDEIDDARALASSVGIKHSVIAIDLFKNEKVVSNPPDRCYHCKLAVFRAIREFAADNTILHVIEGSNSDDRDDYRPGMRALAELGIRSPLMEAGLTKEEIRHVSRDLGLPVWNRPANPCLATRIPQGTAITPGALEAVFRAEQFLRTLGVKEVRVRHHGEIARIEAPRVYWDIIMEEKNAARIGDAMRSLGFKHIALDIGGYRRGSMNKITGIEE